MTATEACYRLNSRLPFTSSTWGKVVRVPAYLGQGGQVTVTPDKLRNTQRPHTLEHLSLAQFLMKAGALVPVAVPLDTDLAPGHLAHLPAVLTLQDGLVMRQLKEARVVDLAPATTYGSIMMLEVNI